MNERTWCEAKTKSGAKCKNYASQGSKFCRVHQKNDASTPRKEEIIEVSPSHTSPAKKKQSSDLGTWIAVAWFGYPWLVLMVYFISEGYNVLLLLFTSIAWGVFSPFLLIFAEIFFTEEIVHTPFVIISFFIAMWIKDRLD